MFYLFVYGGIALGLFFGFTFALESGDYSTFILFLVMLVVAPITQVFLGSMGTMPLNPPSRDAEMAGPDAELVPDDEVPEEQSVSYPKPLPLLHPNAENFEEYCTEWCHYLGYPDAVKTQNTRDGGIDIKGSEMIAQVKFYANPVGVAPVRELNGVKRVGQEALFFALNGFTAEARKFASEVGIQLISVRPVQGTIDILV
jgi:hypothetical protein